MTVLVTGLWVDPRDGLGALIYRACDVLAQCQDGERKRHSNHCKDDSIFGGGCCALVSP